MTPKHFIGDIVPHYGKVAAWYYNGREHYYFFEKDGDVSMIPVVTVDAQDATGCETAE